MNWIIWVTIGGVEFKVRPLRLGLSILLMWAAVRIMGLV